MKIKLNKTHKNTANYKNKSLDYIMVDKILQKALTNIDINQIELESAILETEQIIENNNFSIEELYSINFNLYQLYILNGQDTKALNLINSFDINSVEMLAQISILTNKMKILLNLGGESNILEAIKIMLLLNDKVNTLDWDDKITSSIKSGSLLEIGKTAQILSHIIPEFKEWIDYNLPLQCYDELINSYENHKFQDIDHYLGAKSNKASIMLYDYNSDTQEKGLQIMQEVINEKIKIGYWNGVANNYSTLGLYYFKKQNYKQAIAYTKRDLAITKNYGSLRDLASTLINLSEIYIKVRQLSNARDALRDAIDIFNKIDNKHLAQQCFNNIENINKTAKELKMKDLHIGEKSPCACGSGKAFKSCCGLADFDYEDIGKVLGLDSIVPYSVTSLSEANMSYSNIELSKILRKLEDNELRLSWLKIKNEGAYQEVYELPDMSNLHLTSAKSLLKNFPSDNLIDEVSIALSITMLSVSALEAFLNQLIYFLTTLPENSIPSFIHIPNEIKNDSQNFQRNTRFTDKINIIANILCNGKWNSIYFDCYNDLFKLITIRNELVHFKSFNYFKIIPPQKDTDNKILRDLNPNIELRQITNAWPLKLLTKSFALWSIKTIEKTIDFIKDSYESSVKNEEVVDI